MSTARQLWLGCASGLVLATLAGSPGMAQSTDVSEIVVTGSRLAVNGNEAPTPVTIVSADVLNSVAPQNLADGLNQLPAFRGSTSPQSTGSPAGGGGNRLNLRNFGSNRVLVLLDGRRHVPSTRDGVVDVDLIPQALVSRVDIVTGGASAAYGSDAVSGVVNFILNKEFDGFQADVKSGVSRYGDNFFGSANLLFGKSFASDRGHVLLNVEHYQGDGIAGIDSVEERDWQAKRYMRIPVTGQATPFAIVPNVNLASGSYGGLITTTSLAGLTFNPDGSTRPFVYGDQRSTNYMIGGEDVKIDTSFIAPLRRELVFGRVGYDIASDWTAFAEFTWAEAATRYRQNAPRATGNTAFTIFQDNAFLPPHIRDRMIAESIASFRLARFSRDWGYVTNVGLDTVVRFVAGIEGKIGGWDFDAYYQRGENDRKTTTEDNPIVENVYNAVDAVRGPGGAIVCRSTLTNPGNGCVPINVFGEGNASAAAIDYVLGNTVYHQFYKQDVLAATVRGRPFSTWAGPVGVAFGAEYRRDAVRQVVDDIARVHVTGAGIRGFPTSLVGQVGGYQQTNPQDLAGKITVKELFAETVVPLAQDAPFAKSLDVNAAVRRTDYSTSGAVTSWKVGVTYQIIDDIRIRVARSQDIRAASASELYAGSIESRIVVTDPVSGVTGAVNVNTIGNPTLDPEKAKTWTAGVIFTPRFTPGLSFSLDYWKIDLEGAIQTLGAQVTIDQCLAGATQLCANIIRDPNNVISTLNLPFLNISSRVIEGWDFEANYSTDLDAIFSGAPGRLTVRALVSDFKSDVITNPGAPPVERAGDILSGSVRLTGNLNVRYDNGPFSFILQERYIGHGLRNRSEVEGVDITGNVVPSRLYTDVSARYAFERFGGNVEVYGTINNLFNKDPPVVPSATSSGNAFRGTEFSLYDVVGRYYTVGFRVRY